MLSRFDTILDRIRQRDRQTDTLRQQRRAIHSIQRWKRHTTKV